MPSIESMHFSSTGPSDQHPYDREPGAPSAWRPSARGPIDAEPEAANDTAGEWPLLPFPDGSCATC